MAPPERECLQNACTGEQKSKARHHVCGAAPHSCPSWARAAGGRRPTRTLLIQRSRCNRLNSGNLQPFTRVRVIRCRSLKAFMPDFAVLDSLKCRSLPVLDLRTAPGRRAFGSTQPVPGTPPRLPPIAGEAGGQTSPQLAASASPHNIDGIAISRTDRAGDPGGRGHSSHALWPASSAALSPADGWADSPRFGTSGPTAPQA